MTLASRIEKALREATRLLQNGTINQDEYEARRNAILSATPSVTERHGGLFRWGLVGCIGIIAAVLLFFVVIVIAIAIAIGSSTGKPGEDIHIRLVAGASGTIYPGSQETKKAKVTILELDEDAKSRSPLITPAAGQKFVALLVEIENVGTAEINSFDWKLRDSDNGEHNRRLVVGFVPALEFVNDLTPGGKLNGWVVFEIPANTRVQWVRADPNQFAKTDLYFDTE
jgi:hypothetical protein